MDTIESLKQERDEADRRAGAAERKLKRYAESEFLRETWTDKAKEQWGVHRNVSFDDVWEEALKAKGERDTLAAQLAAEQVHTRVLESTVSSMHRILVLAGADMDNEDEDILDLEPWAKSMAASTQERDQLRSDLAAARQRIEVLEGALGKLVELWDRRDGALVSNYPHVGLKWMNAARAALSQSGATSEKGGEHDPLCDVNDISPEGIKKPCNCGATKAGAALAPEPTPEQPTAEGSAE